MRKLGISEDSCYMMANTRKSYYWAASSKAIHIASTNKRLKQKGLIDPLEYYLKVHTVI